MRLADRLAGWWAAYKLRRGQCRECGAVLRDDARPRSLCGAEDCRFQDWAGQQW